MNKPYYNDQAHIAEEFQLNDNYTCQRAQLATFKIKSYNLSLINAAFCISRKELTGIINETLLNYTDSGTVLDLLGFFDSEIDN
jgi:hypothetical protein